MQCTSCKVRPQLGERLFLPSRGEEVGAGRFLRGCCSVPAPSSSSTRRQSTSLPALAPVCWMRGWRFNASRMLSDHLQDLL